MERHIEQILLEEKYRPTSINDMVLPDYMKNQFNTGISNNLLLVGSPGNGKTTFALALAKQFKYDCKYINGSVKTGIDIIRDEIITFASRRSIKNPDKMKLIIIDEIEGASNSFFKGLRGVTQQFSANTRFIIISNYLNEIPEPLQDRRFFVINFDFSEEYKLDLTKKYLLRLVHICKNENININKDALINLVEQHFPDMGAMINKLQGLSLLNKTIELNDINKIYSNFDELYELVFNNVDPVQNYKFIMAKYKNNVDDVLMSFNENFIDFIKEKYTKHINKIPNIIIKVAYYQEQRTRVIDPILSLLALIFELQNIINNIN